MGQPKRSAFATHSQLGSLRLLMQLAVGIPLSLQKYRLLPHYGLMALGYTVHWSPQEIFAPGGLI